jgi:hypothetical protein
MATDAATPRATPRRAMCAQARTRFEETKRSLVGDER